MKLRTLLLLFILPHVYPQVLAAPVAGARLASASPETPEEHTQRMSWWRKARFGMFIHWGLYSIPAGVWRHEKIPGIGEWIMQKARIPVSDYAKLATEFNPEKFDANKWVQIAKSAGMRYIIITAKHHDGFAMFDSAATRFDIVDATPFLRDPLKELASACAREGIRLGFYYSQAQDWHHPGGAARAGHWDPAQDGDMDDYLREVAYPQVKELFTHYGPVSVLWWDTPENMTTERAERFAPLLALQPGIITNNRLGGGFLGDIETPENRVPATGYPRDWESCMTMNDTWGYKSWDENWKSNKTLIRTLVDIISKGGNFLLNVGPTSEGEIPESSVERLQVVGKWMEENGEAIYGTTASPFLRLGWGRATRKGDKLYLHVFDWPVDGLLVVPMQGVVRKAYQLGVPTLELPLEKTDDGLRIHLPRQAPDPITTVIVLEGVGEVDPLPPPPSGPDNKGMLSLACDEAALAGPGVRVEGNTNLNLTDWRSTSASVSWRIKPDRSGDYEVSLVAKISDKDAGGEYRIIAGAQQLAGQTVKTEGDDFGQQKLGIIHLDAKAVTVTLQAIKIPGDDFIKLRTLLLRPLVGLGGDFR